MSNKFNREIYRALLNEYSDNPSKNFKRKLKASATDGFNLGMYDLSDETFDVKNYRQRIRQARSHHPEYNWRQRRAAALVDVLPQERGAIDLYPTTTMPLSLPTQGSGVPSIVVGYPEVDSVTVSPNKVKMTIHENIYSPRKLSFNQFAGMLDDMMYQQNALTAGQDLNAWQVHRAKEYERYYNDPQNYVYTPIDPSFTYTSDDIAKYRNMGILANNRGIEYYNPSDMRGSYIFKGKSWNDITRENNIPSGKTFSFVSETGDPVDVATLSRIVPKIQNPEAQRAVRQYIATRNPIIVDGGNTVVVDAPHVSTGVAPQDNFYRAANYGEMGIAALATAPPVRPHLHHR